MDIKAKCLLSSLCEQYDEFVRECSQTTFPRSRNLWDEDGVIYVRKMLPSNAFCLARLDFSKDVRGQGVLTGFIDYIKRNPAQFTSIDVELIHNKRLVEKLSKLGFSKKKSLSTIEVQAPTLTFPLNG